MAAQRIPWSATHPAWIYSIMESNSHITAPIRDSFQVHTVEQMTAMRPGSMSFGVERLPYNYFAFGEHIDLSTMEAMRVMREDIYFEYALFSTRKGWYMKEHLDQLILIVHQSGIQKFWLMTTTYKQMDPSVQRSISLSNEHWASEAKRLDVEKLTGIFCMWAVGLAVGVVIFIVEVLVGKKKGKDGEEGHRFPLYTRR